MAYTTNYKIPKVDQGTRISAATLNSILDKIDSAIKQVQSDQPEPQKTLKLKQTITTGGIIYNGISANYEEQIDLSFSADYIILICGTTSDSSARIPIQLTRGDTSEYLRQTSSNGGFSSTNAQTVSLSTYGEIITFRVRSNFNFNSEYYLKQIECYAYE